MHTLPLPPEALIDFFGNTETVVDIDYPASRESLGSPLAVLTYVANLGMTCVLHGDIDDELMTHYMTIRTLTNIYNLQEIHANILYTARTGARLYPIDQFGHEQTVEFIKNNPELIQYQTAFMNSTSLYFFCQLEPSLKEGRTTTGETFPQLGFSLVRLFGVPDFMTMYMVGVPPITDLIYFERYFEDNMFSGAPLYAYFYVPNNMYAGLGLAVSETDAAGLQKLETELTAIRAASDEQFRQLGL